MVEYSPSLEAPHYRDRHPGLFIPPGDFRTEQQWVPNMITQRVARQFSGDTVGRVPDDNPALTQRVVQACARMLAETGRLYGHHPGDVGELQTTRPWHRFSHPTPYHGLTGTIQALEGTTDVMSYRNQLAGKEMPFDMESRRIALLAAAGDDLIFGMYGRKKEGRAQWDEKASEELVAAMLAFLGFDNERHIIPVRACIQASVFNEETSKQQVGHTEYGNLALNEQEASVDGDTFALGTPNGTLNTLLLPPENEWKPDGTNHQIFRAIVRYESTLKGGLPYPRSLGEIFTYFRRYRALGHATGLFLADNESYMLNKHRYNDPAINELMSPGKVQNGRLQTLIGEQMLDRNMDYEQAVHCALAYARYSLGKLPLTQGSLEELTVTPQIITTTLLHRQPLKVLRAGKPENADAFFDRYRRELGIGRLIVPVPSQRSKPTQPAPNPTTPT